MEYIVDNPHQRTPLPNQDCYEYVIGRWSQYLDRVALVDSASGAKYTYGEVQDAVHNIAGHLQALGLSRGTNLAVCASNCVEIPIIQLAVWKLGGMVTFLNPLLKPGEISVSIKDTNPTFLFLDEEKCRMLSAVIPEKSIVLTKEDVEGFRSFASLKAPIEWQPEAFTRDLDDPAIILFSSGTTGPPKAVLLSHINFLACVGGYTCALEAGTLRVSKWTNCIIYLPISHLYGQLLINTNFIGGATSITMPRFDMKRYLQLNADYKCEVMSLVPPLAVLFSKNKEVLAKYDLSSVNGILCGAAFLHPEVTQELLKIIPTETNGIAQGYGMTEVGISNMMPSDSLMATHGAPDLPSSVGLPMPHYKLAVRDLKNGEFLPANKHGEICVSGPGVMMGYLNNKEATDAMIDANGWLATGDIGYYDSNGYFYIVDRLKELIKYKGFQVSPSEMEDLLLTHPNIADAGVVGFPDLECGELPSAFIVLKPGKDLTVDEIRNFVAEKAAPFKKLRGPIELVSQIPRTGSGKILRRCMLSNLQEQHGCGDHSRE